MFLSVFLAVLTTMSIINKAVPQSVQKETAITLSSIATLKGLKVAVAARRADDNRYANSVIFTERARS